MDFCDQIESEIDTPVPGEKISRFQVIRQLLLDQQECYKRSGGPGLFIILLTVRNQMGAIKLSSLLSKNIYHETKSYVDNCNQVNPIPSKGNVQGTHAWALKAFIHNLLRQDLSAPHISAVYFPVVKYTGKTEGSPMLHFMVLCRFDDPRLHSPSSLPENYLFNTTSVRANDEQQLIWEPEPGELVPITSIPDVEEWLKDLNPAMLRERGIVKWARLSRSEKEQF